MSINFSEVIWTVICFFALLFVLKKLLFDPLIRHMDARQSKIDAGLQEARRAEDAREDARRTADEQWKERTEEARHMLNEGMARDDMVRADALEESHVRAARTLAEARQITEREKELTREVVSDRGAELARALADHLLSDEEAG